MSGQLRMVDCEFCAPFVTGPASALRLMTNRIVTTSEDMLLVADHAPITLGHLLLIPRDHHTGMAAFVADDPGAATTLRSLTRTYRDAFGSCTVIEHGSGGAASRAGSCIDHAHWHLFPYKDELKQIIDGDYGDSWRSVRSADEFARDHAGTDYILYWDADEARSAHLSSAARFPQYARSVVARFLNTSAMPYDWDWALHADDELLRRTLAIARSAFMASSDGNSLMKSNNAKRRWRDTFG